MPQTSFEEKNLNSEFQEVREIQQLKITPFEENTELQVSRNEIRRYRNHIQDCQEQELKVKLDQFIQSHPIVKNSRKPIDRQNRILVKEKNEEFKRFQRETKELENKITKLEKEALEQEKDVEKFRGYYEKKLNELLDEIGVTRQHYHGLSFIGNHCEKILQHSAKLCANIKKISRFDYQKYLTIFHKFYLCFQLYSKNEFLSQEEVYHLELRCTSYGNFWNKHFAAVRLLLQNIIF